jgi:hypothetical protein
MVRDKLPESEVDLLIDYMRHALWNIEYHEEGLLKKAKLKAFATTLIIECGCNFSPADAISFYEEQDEDVEFATATDYFKHWLGETLTNRYHEQSLARAHAELAAATAIAQRGKYAIDIEKLRAEGKARFNSR